MFIPSFKIIGFLGHKKRMFKDLNRIRTWRPFWLCDLDHFGTYLSAFTRRLNIKFVLDCGQTFFHKSSINLVIFYKFFHGMTL